MNGFPSWLKAAGWLVSLVVAGAVIGALMVAGSPLAARDERADQTRTEHLTMIAGVLRSYYEREKKLPDSLADLAKLNLEGLRDPVTRSDYGYRRVDEKQYELCATFATDTIKKAPPGHYIYDNSYLDRFRRHEAGRQCFTIDASKPSY